MTSKPFSILWKRRQNSVNSWRLCLRPCLHAPNPKAVPRTLPEESWTPLISPIPRCFNRLAIYRTIPNFNRLIFRIWAQEETFHEIELADSKSHATIGKLSYVARLVDRGPQLTKDVVLRVQSNRKAEPSEFPPSIFDDATEKIVDELEDWKERQKDRFRHEVRYFFFLLFKNLFPPYPSRVYRSIFSSR